MIAHHLKRTREFWSGYLCFAELHSDADTIEGGRIDSTFVKRENGGVRAGCTDEIPLFVVEVKKVVLNKHVKEVTKLHSGYCTCCARVHLNLRESETF